MKILFFDRDNERMNENFNYFVNVEDVVFMAAGNTDMLRKICSAADAVVIYDCDDLSPDVMPVGNDAVYFICEKDKPSSEIKRYCMGAAAADMMKTEELYNYIRKEHGFLHDTSVSGRIERFIGRYGIHPHLRGYEYIKSALKLCLKDKEALKGVTKILYPSLSKKFNSSPHCIERSIRTAVEQSWNSENEFYKKVFYHMPDKRPSNAAFLRAAVNYLNMEDEL